MRNIRLGLVDLNKIYTGKSVTFMVKDKIGKQFREFKYNEKIQNIEYDKLRNIYKIFLKN